VTLALVVAASLPFAVLLAGRPVVRRLALRSMARRPVELALVVVGSMLATAILTGSLLVGDTVDRSIRAQAYDQLGPVDEVVAVSGLERGEELFAALDGFTSPDVDGLLPMVTARAAAVGRGTETLVQPVAQLVEIDFGRASTFGGDPGATGLRGATPATGRAAITTDLARKIRIGPGDTVVVFAYGTSLPLEVDRVLPRTGVAGFWLGLGQRSYNVFVTPGTIARLATGTAVAGAEPPTALVAVSNRGGVEGGAAATGVVTAQLDAALGRVGAAARPVKQNLLDAAEAFGSSLGELYFTIGMFAVVAGMLLLVNLFVMLADERRHELGIMRAVGLRRSPMVGQFAAEGWVYALASAAVGAVAGIGMGWIIAWRSGQILSSGREVERLRIEFAFERATVVRGFAIGFLISLITIVATSSRIARLNVIAAIRDLPDAGRRGRFRHAPAAGLLVAVAGTAWATVGVVSPDAYGVVMGPVLVAVGLGPLAARHHAGRAVVTAVGAFSLAWAVSAVWLVGALDVGLDIPLFLVQGLILVAAAVAVVTVHQARIGRALSRLTSGSTTVRVGLAYPLARTLRTAMTIGMVAIVVLTLTYISVLNAMFNGQADEMTADLAGGFEVVVQSNPSDPVPVEAAGAIAGVDAVAPIGYAAVDFGVGGEDPVTWPVSGFDRTLLTAPPTLVDLGPHPNAAAAWAAVLADPGLVIVDEFFLVTGAGPPAETVEVGDEVVLIDPWSGQRRTLRVAALAASDLVGHGAFYGVGGLADLLGERVVRSRLLVSTGEPDAVVERLRRSFVANGVEAETIRDRVEGALSLNNAFFTLMQQFVGAGLVVGMAGIGVIMVRAVRERRREIGVLRALGFPTRSVGWSFVVEASFVAVEGAVVGMATALVASYGLATSGASWAEGLRWTVPAAELAVIGVLTVGAALVASLWPARSAARTRPAAALRLGD
jgi:putative ABC transport system permease protein